MSNSIFQYKSDIVMIGSVPLGGNYPVRLQSMTNTDTLNTEASAAQCIRIIEAGADFVRLTAQGVKEAENLGNISRMIRKAGFDTPLIADIHFNPSAAETAAKIVEKVRINPGNYADKRASFIKVDLSEKEYAEELERIHERVLPLINICHSNNTAVRIGVNHGSLSDRIMTRYGNTPLGMAVSAIEFMRIFRAENFSKLVLSMKSSDIAVMIEAVRLSVKLMKEEGFAYPIHLGVTEAGEGEDGRVRSSAGIGALLSEGIGDTIRVSLSEDPEIEIPVARKLAGFFQHAGIIKREAAVKYRSPENKPIVVRKISGPLVIANMTRYVTLNPESYKDAGYNTDPSTGKFIKGDGAADFIIASYCPDEIPSAVSLIVPFKIWLENKNNNNVYPLFSPETYCEPGDLSEKLNFILTGSNFNRELLGRIDASNSILIYTFDSRKEPGAPNELFEVLPAINPGLSVILNPIFSESDTEELIIKAPALLGIYVTDRQAAGISITNNGLVGVRDTNRLSFSVLQCTETRITRTMYLSCPTCGRTKFNLQEAVKKVREKTGHLKGLKIAVMGCIVNGPGEMAGADWGYVGAGDGKVHIYKGTEPVLKNIPEEDAAEELLRLIQASL